MAVKRALSLQISVGAPEDYDNRFIPGIRAGTFITHTPGLKDAHCLKLFNRERY